MRTLIGDDLAFLLDFEIQYNVKPTYHFCVFATELLKRVARRVLRKYLSISSDWNYETGV